MVYNVHGSAKQQQKAFRCRAWLDGTEVTSRCFYADPRRGVVRLYELNAGGQKYVEYGDGEPRAAVEERRGRVVVRRPTG